MSTIGDRIRERRIALGMSVDDLASRIGKNRATIYRYESDFIENMPISVIKPLSDVLGVSPAYLMGWVDTPKQSITEPINNESSNGETEGFMDEIRKLIGDNIKRVCTSRGVHQVDIARHLKVSQGTVSNWFKGTNSIDIENLAELCRYLGVSLDQVFGFAAFDSAAVFSADESELIALYRQLNDDAKSTLLNTARAFAGNPDMKTAPRSNKELA